MIVRVSSNSISVQNVIVRTISWIYQILSFRQTSLDRYRWVFLIRYKIYSLVAIWSPQIRPVQWTTIPISNAKRSSVVATPSSSITSVYTGRSSSIYIFCFVCNTYGWTFNGFDSIFFFEIFICINQEYKGRKDQHCKIEIHGAQNQNNGKIFQELMLFFSGWTI